MNRAARSCAGARRTAAIASLRGLSPGGMRTPDCSCSRGFGASASIVTSRNDARTGGGRLTPGVDPYREPGVDCERLRWVRRGHVFVEAGVFGGGRTEQSGPPAARIGSNDWLAPRPRCAGSNGRRNLGFAVRWGHRGVAWPAEASRTPSRQWCPPIVRSER